MKFQNEKFPTYRSAGRLLIAALVASSLVSACADDSAPADASVSEGKAETSDAPDRPAATGATAELTARHSEPSGYLVRDSAGVEIVETAGSAWTAETAWTVDPEPLASLGGERTGGSSLHGTGRIVRLSDGGFVVAHKRGSQLLWFNGDGTFRIASGHLGRAPGGFMVLGDLLAMPGDSVLAVDSEIGRVSVFGPDGEFARLESIDFVAAGSPSLVAVLPNGTIVGQTDFVFEEGMSAGVNRDSRPFAILQPKGGFELTEVQFPTSEQWLFQFGEALAGGPLPFGSESYVAAADGGFWFGTGDRPEVGLHDAEGQLVTVIRWSGEAESLPAERAEQFKVDALASAGSNPATVAEVSSFLRDLPFPEQVPSMGGLAVDPDGNVWVGPYSAWTEPAGGWWTVFDAAGRRLGTVEVPRGFEVRAIGTDRLYGVWTDAEGTESIRVYGLKK